MTLFKPTKETPHGRLERLRETDAGRRSAGEEVLAKKALEDGFYWARLTWGGGDVVEVWRGKVYEIMCEEPLPTVAYKIISERLVPPVTT